MIEPQTTPTRSICAPSVLPFAIIPSIPLSHPEPILSSTPSTAPSESSRNRDSGSLDILEQSIPSPDPRALTGAGFVEASRDADGTRRGGEALQACRLFHREGRILPGTRPRLHPIDRRERPGIHRRDPRWFRLADRRTRGSAFRRTATATRHRASDPRRPGNPDPRRGDQQP